MNIRRFRNSDTDWIQLENFTEVTQSPTDEEFSDYKEVITQAYEDALEYLHLPDQLTIVVGQRTPESTESALETEFGRKSITSGYSFP